VILVARARRRSVSIRAPARGATDPDPVPQMWIAMFQSAPLREGRQVSLTFTVPETLCFNPRPCARGDYVIFTLTRGGE